MTVPTSDPARPPTPTGDVVVVPWPRAVVLRARARVAGRPRLLVVAAGTPPPTDCGRDEDWASESAPAADVAARMATLAARPPARPSLPGAFVDRLGDVDVLVLDVLDRHQGRAVRDDVLVEVAGSAAALDRSVRTLRRHLRPLDYDVLAGPAVTLLVVPPPPGAQHGSFV